MTHSFGECPNAAVESHLSQILEASPHPKYCLSAKACQGILNRAARRGKDLPEALKAALLSQSESGGGCDGGGKGALVQTEVSGTLGCNNDQTVFCLQGNGIDRADTAGCNGKGWREDKCYTLNTIDRPAVCAGFKLGNGEAARSIGYAEELSPTLNAECGGNKPAVLCLNSWDSQSARVYSEDGVWHSLNANSNGGQNRDAVLCLNDQGGSVMGVTENVCGTLRAQEHGHQPLVTVFDPAQITSPVNHSRPEPGKPCHTLTSRMGTGGGNVPIMFRQQRFESYVRDDTAGTCKARDSNDGTTTLVCAAAGTLQAKESGGNSLNLNNVVRKSMTVRRLTPLECERLQGFPDGWTDIGDWVDSKGKKRQTTDSARYKALGNSIALPPWKWVLKRLCAQYERDATMASLFDGIGGFPLIWEQLNGKGSCLWASEIEEFPISVTKKHFG